MKIRQHTNNHWIKKKIEREIKDYLETNKNGNTTYQNLWEAAKANLRGKFTKIMPAVRRKEKILSKQCNFIPQGTRKRIN